jgi:hypothetical protein
MARSWSADILQSLSSLSQVVSTRPRSLKELSTVICTGTIAGFGQTTIQPSFTSCATITPGLLLSSILSIFHQSDGTHREESGGCVDNLLPAGVGKYRWPLRVVRFSPRVDPVVHRLARTNRSHTNKLFGGQFRDRFWWLSTSSATQKKPVQPFRAEQQELRQAES